MMKSFSLFVSLFLSPPLCINISLLLTQTFSYMPPLCGMYFHTQECPMCGFSEGKAHGVNSFSHYFKLHQHHLDEVSFMM